MPTCLFTAEELPPTTTEEHALPRSLGGRIRSRRITSDRFNNATSKGFDDLLAGPYVQAFNYLAPLLSVEHQQSSIEIEVAGGRRHRLYPGGQLGVHGVRVEQRSADGRPLAAVHEDVNSLRGFAANVGWPPDAWRQSHELASIAIEGRRQDVPILSPNMEIAALKCALLAFDEVLADQGREPFTRSGWLSSTRDAIRDIVLKSAAPFGFLERVCWGLSCSELDVIRQLRAEFVQDEESPCEHILIASGEPVSGIVDVAWVLAGMDVWRFRLTRLWNGPPFTVLAGCGILRGTSRWKPVVHEECHWQLSDRSSARAVQRCESDDVQRIASDVAEARHEAYRRVVDVVERRSDDVVRGGILNLARFPEAEPVMHRGSTAVAHGLERRLRRLFFGQCSDPAKLQFLTEQIAANVAELSQDVQNETVARDDDLGAGVTWDAWVACHRRVLDAVAPKLGLPGRIFSIAVSAEPVVV